MAVKAIAFEEKKYCQIRSLAARWDCSTGRIHDLISRGVLSAWHPEGKADSKGRMVEVASVLEAEKNGKLTLGLNGDDDAE